MYNWIENIFVRNDTLFVSFPETRNPLSAHTWTLKRSEKSIYELKKQALEFSLDYSLQNFPHLEPWVLISNRTLQPDTKLIRHLGLWKSLKNSGIDFISDNSQTIFRMYPNEDGLWIGGAVKYQRGQLENIFKAMLEYDVRIVLLNAETTLSKIDETLESQWNLNTNPLEKLLNLIGFDNGIVIDISGEFDDIDILVSFIGKKEVLGRQEKNEPLD